MSQLFDVPKLQALLDSLDEIYSIPSAIIDLEGNILTATAWQDICVKFHRVNPECKKECIKSDTYIAGQLLKGEKQVRYVCPHGLVDTATPIIVDGMHLGNAFTGQLFLNSPEEDFFRKQAKRYGFDEEVYIKALRKVPVVSEKKLNQNLAVLSHLTEMLAEQGLQQARRIETEQQISKSLKEKEVLLNEVHHRVKNNMAVISSLLSLQSRYIDDKKYLDMFKESQGRIRSMALVHEQLYKSKDFSNIDVADYIETLARNVRNTFGGGRESNITFDVQSINLGIDELIPLGLLINEILTNAYKYGFDGRGHLNVDISLGRHSAGKLALSVTDDGKGLPDDFDIGTSKGLGLKLVQTLAAQLDGELMIEKRPAKFVIVFPEQIGRARQNRALSY